MHPFPHPSQPLSSILSRMRERRRLLFPPLGERWIEGWRTVSWLPLQYIGELFGETFETC
jgi:hypothetical protein